MEQKIVTKLKSWFSGYVDSFKAKGDIDLEQNIILKEVHSRYVAREICTIGTDLGLSADELRLAEVLGLLHDIGRFEQYERFRTFVDRNSVNHAEFGVELLQKYQVLELLDEDQRNLVLRAIGYHNRARLPEKENERCLFFSKLLRDADKLDILRVVTEYYHEKSLGKKNEAVELDLPDTPDFSTSICQALIKGKIIEFREMKTLNDFKLLQMGWVYDTNFVPTLSRVKERRYLEIIYATLPPAVMIEEAYQAVQSYVKEKIEAAP